LTGGGVVSAEGGTFAYLPKLPEGSYVLSYSGGSVEVLIGDAAAPTPEPAPGRLQRIAAGAALLFAVVLVLVSARRRSKVFLVPGLGLATLGVVLLAAGADHSDLSTLPDPCPQVEGASQDCMVDHMETVFAAEGPKAAVARLEQLASRPGSAWEQGCHDPAHYLGHFAGRVDEPIAELVAYGTLTCSFGYFHGLLEVLGTYSTDEAFPRTAQEVCRLLEASFEGEVRLQDIRECAHGIGHAAMWRTNEDYGRAREVCAGLGTPEKVDECISGAVMSWVFAKEQALKTGRVDELPEPRVGNPVELCAPPHGDLGAGCVDGALMGVEFADFESSLDWCRANLSVAEVCGRSLSRNVMAWELRGLTSATELLPGLCESLVTDSYQESSCLSDGAFFHMYFIRDFERAKEFCASVRPDKVADCRRGIAVFYAQGAARGDKSVGEPPAEIADEVAAVRL
jgi:hypothetical protein